MSISPAALLKDDRYFDRVVHSRWLQKMRVRIMRYDPYTMTNRLILEGLVISVAFCLAFFLRHGGQVPKANLHQMQWLLAPFVVGRLLTGFVFGLHRMQWRYLCMTDAFWSCVANSAFTLFFFALRFGTPESWSILRVPDSVIVIEFFLSTQAALTVRMLRRYVYERQKAREVVTPGTQKPRRLLLIGAGVLGSTVAKEIGSRPGAKLVGFLDDDPKKIGSVVAGACVLGPCSLLAELVRRGEVDDVLVCIPATARNSFNRLWALLEHLPIRSRVVPTIDEILDIPDITSTNGTRKSQSPNGDQTHVGSRRDPELPKPAEIRGKTILITGGAGFIGSSVAQRLAAENKIVLFDRFFEEQPISFTSLLANPNVRAVEGDIMDDGILGRLAAEADIVVHAAAIVGVSRVCSHPRETLETNFVGTSRLLRALEKNLRLERIVYFSTSEVFGVNSFRVHENTPAAVGPAVEARWSYAIAKLAGEHLAKSYHRQTGMPIVTVRPFNIFGPRRLGAHAIRSFVLNSLNGNPIEVHGDGSQIRSWCYIEDFCDALIEMIARPEAVGEDFNIGNPRNTITIHQLAQKVTEFTGARVPIVFRETDIPDIDIRVPSLEKARRLLDYEPKYDIDQALALTIEWYRKNLPSVSKLGRVAPVTAGFAPTELIPTGTIPAKTTEGGVQSSCVAAS